MAMPTVAVSVIGVIVKSGGKLKASVDFGVDGVDQSEEPTPFVALTLKMYEVSDSKPVTTKGEAES
jgi:hypothetical protein